MKFNSAHAHWQVPGQCLVLVVNDTSDLDLHLPQFCPFWNELMASYIDLIVQVPGIISVSAKLLPTIQNLVNKMAAEQQAEHTPPVAEAPVPQLQPPPLLLSPRSPMSELRRMHMPPSPVRKLATPSTPSSPSSSSTMSSPRHFAEDQKPRPTVAQPENESNNADSIVWSIWLYGDLIYTVKCEGMGILLSPSFSTYKKNEII